MPPRSDRAEYVHLTRAGGCRSPVPVALRDERVPQRVPAHLDRRDEIVLAVGEAAANAVEHAYRDRPEPGVIDVTLWTESDARPACRSATTAAGANPRPDLARRGRAWASS